MKKRYLLLIILLTFTFILKTSAASAALSVSSNTVNVGKKFTVTVNMKSAAAWNIHVTSSGPVKNCTINQADATADAMDTSKKFTATCTATAEGTIIIKLTGDVTSAATGNAVNISGTKTITVTKKVSENTTDNNSSTNKSKNNKLKSLSAEGFLLTKLNDNNYTLTVVNNITKITLNAIAEDEKATVKGTGEHELKVGDNNFEIIVISESGAKNIINVKISRKDGYYLEDLDALLTNGSKKEIELAIKNDTKLTVQDLTKIKDSGKNIILNYYDANKILLYSWFIANSEIDTSKEFETKISFNSDNSKEISKLSNYAEGLEIVLKSNNLPNKSKLKIYVGDKYAQSDIVNIYYYDQNLVLLKNNVKLESGYLEFEPNSKNEFLITKSLLENKNLENKNNTPTALIILVIILMLTTILLLINLLSIKKKYNKLLKRQ